MKKKGILIKDFEYCPHHPEALDKRYRMKCECRKPKPGMLLKAAIENKLSISNSFLIGDREKDVQAGKDAGCKTIFLNKKKNKMLETKIKEINIRRIKIIKLATTV